MAGKAEEKKRLEDFIEYREDGVLFWKKSPAKCVSPGSVVGNINKRGYVDFRFNGCRYYGHRVVWYLHYGVFPSGVIDHINGNPSDNRIENLRECTQKNNLGNTRSHRDSTSKYKGVYFDKRSQCWAASCRGRRLGIFQLEEEAARAYDTEAFLVFGEFAKTNFERKQDE